MNKRLLERMKKIKELHPLDVRNTQLNPKQRKENFDMWYDETYGNSMGDTLFIIVLIIILLGTMGIYGLAIFNLI